MAKLAANIYGNALFELSVEKHQVQELLEEVTAVREIFREHDELTKLMNHPKIINEDKVSLVEDIFRERISGELLGFIAIIIRKGRYNEMFSIFDYFIARVKEYQGIGIAYVASAVALSAQQQAGLEQRLLETTRYSSFEMHYTVLPELIGGLKIRINDRVIDSSVKNKLQELSKALQRIQLA